MRRMTWIMLLMLSFRFAAFATGNVQKLERGLPALSEGGLVEEFFEDAVEIFVLQRFKG